MPFAVGGYIAAAHWFTSSTSFANPVRLLYPDARQIAEGIAS
jgi:hypothetical protein